MQTAQAKFAFFAPAGQIVKSYVACGASPDAYLAACAFFFGELKQSSQQGLNQAKRPIKPPGSNGISSRN